MFKFLSRVKLSLSKKLLKFTSKSFNGLELIDILQLKSNIDYYIHTNEPINFQYTTFDPIRIHSSSKVVLNKFGSNTEGLNKHLIEEGKRNIYNTILEELIKSDILKITIKDDEFNPNILHLETDLIVNKQRNY